MDMTAVEASATTRDGQIGGDRVAEELRATHTGERIVARFEDEDEE